MLLLPLFLLPKVPVAFSAVIEQPGKKSFSRFARFCPVLLPSFSMRLEPLILDGKNRNARAFLVYQSPPMEGNPSVSRLHLFSFGVRSDAALLFDLFKRSFGRAGASLRRFLTSPSKNTLSQYTVPCVLPSTQTHGIFGMRPPPPSFPSCGVCWTRGVFASSRTVFFPPPRVLKRLPLYSPPPFSEEDTS